MSAVLSPPLQAHLKKLQGQAGFAAENLTQGRQIIWGNRPFLAASTIKVPVLAVYEQARQMGEIPAQDYCFQVQDYVEDSPFFDSLEPGATVSWDELARQMIIISDNTATNLLIRQLGLERIQAWITAQGLSETKIAREMMDLRARARGIDNWTSPLDMCQLMRKLVTGQLLPPGTTGCARMLEILHQQQDREKIPHFFSAPVVVANKPGELPGTRSDIGYLHAPGRAVVMALFTDQLQDDAAADLWLAELAVLLWQELTDS